MLVYIHFKTMRPKLPSKPKCSFTNILYNWNNTSLFLNVTLLQQNPLYRLPSEVFASLAANVWDSYTKANRSLCTTLSFRKTKRQQSAFQFFLLKCMTSHLQPLTPLVTFRPITELIYTLLQNPNILIATCPLTYFYIISKLGCLSLHSHFRLVV